MNNPDGTVTQSQIAEGRDGLAASTSRRSEEKGFSAADSISATTSCRLMRELASSEMAKSRRRLGPLTLEQERALESLLETLVARLSLMLSAVGAVDE